MPLIKNQGTEMEIQTAERLAPRRRAATATQFRVQRGSLAAAGRAQNRTETRLQDRTDEQLVALAQQGQQRAFEFLVRKYQSRIVYLLSCMVGESDAQD